MLLSGYRGLSSLHFRDIMSSYVVNILQDTCFAMYSDRIFFGDRLEDHYLGIGSSESKPVVRGRCKFLLRRGVEEMYLQT